MINRTTLSLLLVSLVLPAKIANAAEPVDFNRDVRPILSDRCFVCHGPDAQRVEADLRLDLEEAAKEYAIVPGDPEGSEVFVRIASTDHDLRMPPVDSKLSLTDAEIDTIRRWIEQGANYEEHWAFQPLPESVPLPQVKENTWVRQPLDAFPLATLESQGLRPSPEAERWRWLRRVTFDLTGLPPTPEEIEAFENDTTDQAYDKVVERLLNSPQFGEQMAVAWLDAARYADSYGYQSDKLNTQWPYRDWVVRAFNSNLPYDQFLTWQLAGDLLENPTRDQRLATAFNRLHRLNNEGGAVFEEWRIENVADRVHTFGTAVLGLTMECARCHDHKYDPISQRDYYSLFAFFNSIDESGVYDRTEKVPCPSMLLPTPEQSKALEQAREQVKNAEAAYVQAIAAATKRFEECKNAASSSAENEIPDLRIALGFDRPFEDSIKDIYHPSALDRGWTTPVPLVPVTDCTVPALDPSLAADRDENATPARLALQLDGERGVTTHGIEPFDRWAPFSVVLTLRETQRSEHRSIIAHHTRGTDCGYNGWDLAIENGRLDVRLGREWPGNSISVRTIDPIPSDAWCQIAATYDGSSRADGLRLFLNGQPLKTETLRDELKKQANVKVDHGGEFVIGQRFRDRGFAGGLIDDARVYERALTAAELQHLATGAPLESTLEYYLSAVDEETRKAAAKLAEAREAFVMAEEAMVEIPIMRDTESPREAHILARGQYDAPTSAETRVTREVPAHVGPAFPEDAPRDRLGLARWVTQPDHPLTARVAVNRLWANFFGAGLVGTPENFGLQGEMPTHPELLDWLARDFIESGWDVKRFCRNVVLSATYRQSSVSTEQLREIDPINRLLARGPAYRLSAEQIRDLALAASDLLNPEQSGPPVSPYQPGEDLWRESNGMSPPYEQSVGEALYRRSLYSVWKRTAPLPNMMAFDTSTREVCTVRRDRTNTPLQALVLLNDVQFVEASRQLAATAIDQHRTDEARITHAFVSLTGREPDGTERRALTNLLNAEREFYRNHDDEAQKLISLGDSSPGDNVKPEELAALTTVCQAILNLDATIWKR